MMGEHLRLLREWAKPKGLDVGAQREPENVVVVREYGSPTNLIRRTSTDSVDTAAMYVLNTLERLGARDEKLRAALREIAEAKPRPLLDPHDCEGRLRRMAREALSG